MEKYTQQSNWLNTKHENKNELFDKKKCVMVC